LLGTPIVTRPVSTPRQASKRRREVRRRVGNMGIVVPTET
jgi:hypothetical protein